MQRLESVRRRWEKPGMASGRRQRGSYAAWHEHQEVARSNEVALETQVSDPPTNLGHHQGRERGAAAPWEGVTQPPGECR